MFHLDLNNKVTDQIGAAGTKDVETLVLLKYLSDLWKTLERKLINCKINLILTWSENSTIVSSTDKKKKKNSSSNNIDLRKVDVELHGFDKMYMDKDLIQDNLYQILDQFNKKKITSRVLFNASKQNISAL